MPCSKDTICRRQEGRFCVGLLEFRRCLGHEKRGRSPSFHADETDSVGGAGEALLRVEAEVNVIRGPDHAGELGGQGLVFGIGLPLGVALGQVCLVSGSIRVGNRDEEGVGVFSKDSFQKEEDVVVAHGLVEGEHLVPNGHDLIGRGVHVPAHVAAERLVCELGHVRGEHAAFGLELVEFGPRPIPETVGIHEFRGARGVGHHALPEGLVGGPLRVPGGFERGEVRVAEDEVPVAFIAGVEIPVGAVLRMLGEQVRLVGVNQVQAAFQVVDLRFGDGYIAERELGTGGKGHAECEEGKGRTNHRVWFDLRRKNLTNGTDIQMRVVDIHSVGGRQWGHEVEGDFGG